MFEDENAVTFAELALYFAGSNALAFLTQKLYARRIRSQLTRVGQIDSLFIYPIKSCSDVSVEKAFCDETGIRSGNARDRHFVIVTGEGGKPPGQVITQRQYPQMALVQPKLLRVDPDERGAVWGFSAPEMPDLQVELPISDKNHTIAKAKLWGQAIYGRHCGKEAAKWWQAYLKRDDVLMIHADSPGYLKSVLKTTAKMPAASAERIGENTKTGYTDWAPLHIVNARSIEELNSRVEDSETSPVDVSNFRPNLFIRTAAPFEEDTFDRLYIGSESDFEIIDANVVTSPSVTILRTIRPNDRCALTVVDSQKGKRRPDGEPLKTLKCYRLSQDVFGNSPIFGVDAAVDRPGAIRKGDVIFATFL